MSNIVVLVDFTVTVVTGTAVDGQPVGRAYTVREEVQTGGSTRMYVAHESAASIAAAADELVQKVRADFGKLTFEGVEQPHPVIEMTMVDPES